MTYEVIRMKYEEAIKFCEGYLPQTDTKKFIIESLEKLEEAQITIKKLLASYNGSPCQFCIQDKNPDAGCSKGFNGIGTWCEENCSWSGSADMAGHVIVPAYWREKQIQKYFKYQWHDLRSDEEDLPQKDMDILVVNDDNIQHIAVLKEDEDGFYEWKIKYCLYDYDSWDEDENGKIVAWRYLEPPRCEMTYARLRKVSRKFMGDGK